MFTPKTVAIDGPSAVGKNAVGSLLAKRLGYRFVDTGAMYRALTWKAIQLGIDLTNEETLAKLAAETDINLIPSENDEPYHIIVNGHDVSHDIRSDSVEKGVSLVSKVAGVRQVLVAQQRDLAQNDHVVMVGRDIGTVVLPDADLKIFLSASVGERAHRRHRELVKCGVQSDYESVQASLEMRDRIDSERTVSPLQPALDATVIETDDIDEEHVLAQILDMIKAHR